MKEEEKEKKETKKPAQPLKPKHPHTKGAPNDTDPQAQYEDKDES